MIRTGSMQIAAIVAGGYKKFVERCVFERWQGRVNWQVQGQPAIAVVNHSDWVAECPDCPEWLIVEPGEPFFCPNCQNVKNGGLARPVQFPAQKATIEAILKKRAIPQTRNWTTETVDELRRENRVMGEETD